MNCDNRIAEPGGRLLRPFSMKPHILIIFCLAFVPPVAAHGESKAVDQEIEKKAPPKAAENGQSTKKKAPRPTSASAKAPRSFIEFKCSQERATVFLGGRVVGLLPLPGPWLVKSGTHDIEFRSNERVLKRIRVLVRPGATESVSCEDAKALLNPAQQAALTRYRWAPLTISDIGLGIAVAGMVSIGVGAWYGLESKQRSDEATKMLIRETYRRDFQRLADMAEESALAANLSYGIGAAGLIAGLAMAFFGEGGLFAVSSDQDASGVIIQGEF